MKQTILVLTLLAGVCYARDPVAVKVPQSECWCYANVVRVIDADTLVADVYLPWGVCLIDQTLRVDTHDCWESSKRRQSEAAGEITDEEVAKGKTAERELTETLQDWQLWVRPGITPRDNYGRLLGPWQLRNGFKVEDMQAVAKRKGWLRTKAGK